MTAADTRTRVALALRVAEEHLRWAEREHISYSAVARMLGGVPRRSVTRGAALHLLARAWLELDPCRD